MHITLRDFPPEIAVEVDNHLLQTIHERATEVFETKTALWRYTAEETSYSWSTVKNKFKPSHCHRIPLRLLFLASEKLEIADYQLREGISSYSVVRGSTAIIEPALPIIVSPIFDMLVAHHISDGTLVCAQGRLPYFGYRQFDNKLRQSYRDKLEQVFGKIAYSQDYTGKKETTRIYAPVAASQIILSYLGQGEKAYLSTTAQVPQTIKKHSPSHKLAFLLGVFIDEGSVDANQAVIRMKNFEVIKTLQEFCRELKYSCKTTSYENGMHQLYIHARSIPKFYTDFLHLQNKYPFLTLSYKGGQLRKATDRLQKPRRYLPGNKKRILQFLTREPLTVNEIAERCSMTRQGARYHIKTLINAGKVRHTETLPGKPPEYVYSAKWE